MDTLSNCERGKFDDVDDVAFQGVEVGVETADRLGLDGAHRAGAVEEEASNRRRRCSILSELGPSLRGGGKEPGDADLPRPNVEPGPIYQDANVEVTAVENTHFNFPPGSPPYGKYKSYSYRFETRLAAPSSSPATPARATPWLVWRKTGSLRHWGNVAWGYRGAL
jgi:hypothetical protein